MINLETVVQQIGLSENEAKTYLAALELGETSITELAKKALLKRPTTYLAVDRLEMLGLLSKIKKGKRNTLSPVHPRRLVQIAKLREKDLEENFPKLLGLYDDNQNKPKIQMFEGHDAVNRLYQEIYGQMAEKKEFLFFSNITSVSSQFYTVANEYIKLIKQYKDIRVRELIVDDERGRTWAKENMKVGNKSYEVRLLPKECSLGENEIMIAQKTVTYFSAGRDIFAINIESEDLAKTQRAMYELAWSLGKSLN